MRLLCATMLSLLVFGPAIATAQAAASPDTALVVMNLAAHPDDEDGRTLAYYRWARDARAYSVIYTRGEGGQNEIGPELYEELGAIRTHETERAARILGTQVYFLNFEDFGFSKTAEETFERWGGRDSVTARITYLIRKLKPDVLFTNHDTVTVGPGRAHGHHQAVGLSAFDAFELAADPGYHPEQLREEGVDLWQPKRLFLRHWNRPADVDVAVPVGNVFDRDRSYADLAGEALREHESQGMGMFAGRFNTPETYFTLLRQHGTEPLDDADLAGNLVPHPNRPAPLRYLIDSGRIEALDPDALIIADSVATPGSSVRLSWDTNSLPPLPLRIRLTGAVDTTLTVTKDTPPSATLRIAPDAFPSRPAPLFQYERYLSSPPIAYAVHSLPSGERTHAGYLPLDVAPAVLLTTPVETIRLQHTTANVPLNVAVWDPTVDEVTVRASVFDPSDRNVLGEHYETFTFNGRSSWSDTLSVSIPDALAEGQYGVVLTASTDSPPRVIHHTMAARSFEVSAPAGLRVGIIESYDDALSHALSELGVEHVLLDSLTLAAGDLDDLHTIVLDIRAYLVRPDLQVYNDRLLEWVRAGGNLIVNYHKTFEWEGDRYPPFPIELSRARVTREDAPVRLLRPDHLLFNEPNEVRADDWDGWVQERGLYFPSNYDERYVELFELNDPGEPEQRGSTLLAEYGEGTYIYTALVWYRQLKEFHPGAFRMFANMISLPVTDGRVDPGLSATGR